MYRHEPPQPPRLEALGATRYDHQQERGYDFWVLRDPWANEFCVLQVNFPDLLAQQQLWPDFGTAESGPFQIKGRASRRSAAPRVLATLQAAPPHAARISLTVATHRINTRRLSS